jgi:hypothetical protein
MLPIEKKLEYIDGMTCGACGCDPEVVAWYKRGENICGFQCSCSAIIIDGIVVGAGMP